MTRTRKDEQAETIDKYGQKPTYVIGCPANGCGELSVIERGRAKCPKCGEVVTEARFTE